MDHAILAPSAASRWTVCTPSARLEQGFENVESPAAWEGTLAHAIAEALLKAFLKTGDTCLSRTEEAYFKKQEFYSEAMYDYSLDFVNYVLEFYHSKDKKNKLFVEIELDLSPFIKEGFGHSDAAVIQVKQKHLHVIDLKFGKGVPVSADNNTQLKIYALGVLEFLDFYGYNYPIENITLHIFQPRIANNSTYTLSIKELRVWAEYELKPAADMAFSGKGKLVPGSHCRFCNAAPQCRALADFNQGLAKNDFDDLMLLEDPELMEIYSKLGIFEAWLKSIKSFTLREALKGRNWPGYKIVEGRSNRAYRDPEAVEKVILEKLFISNMHKPKELLGLEDMQDLLGKEQFNTYIEPLLIKPPGKPALAPTTDKRPVFNSALVDFKTELAYDDYLD